MKKIKTDSFIKRISAMFFPARCPICLNPMKPMQYCCDDCIKTLPNEPFRRVDMLDVLGGKTFLVDSPLKYEGKYRNSIYKLKFKGKTDYAYAFAGLMSTAINDFNVEFDIITCVPMYKGTYEARKNNHSEIIAKELSKISKIKYLDCLEKTRRTKTQHTLSAKERETNVINAYKVIGDVRNKRILLIDDVVTTGNTIKECAKMLYLSGADRVCGLCAADAQLQR